MELKLNIVNLFSIHNVFQSYLYGIEIAQYTLLAHPATSFNRTFMELKCVQRVIKGEHIISFNRTFMELK